MNWEERYRSGNTPWDLGEPHPELARCLAAGWPKKPEPGRAFVPGCGTGYDALALARAGWSVTAIDLVDATAGRLGRELSARSGRFVVADALEFDDEERFDLVWDHTFFCAIDPSRRTDWRAMVGRVLRDAGMVAGISFPEDRTLEDGGPPWGMSVETVEDLLERFDLIDVRPPDSPVVRRLGRERWYELRRD